MHPSSTTGKPFLLIVIAIALLCLFGWTLAQAHDWYPMECCSQRDCFKVNMDELVESNNGDWLYLPRNLTFSKDKIRPSQDRNFHVCIGNMEHNMGKPLCAFILQGA